jgi:hypothetical protein
MINLRFVVVATTLRGGLKKPELLDDANQWRAFSAWRMSESRDQRVAFEMRETVVWVNPGKVRR